MIIYNCILGVLAFVLARFSVLHGVQLCRVWIRWECDVVRRVSCGLVSFRGVWYAFGMVSAAPLTDGHSSIGGSID